MAGPGWVLAACEARDVDHGGVRPAPAFGCLATVPTRLASRLRTISSHSDHAPPPNKAPRAESRTARHIVCQNGSAVSARAHAAARSEYRMRTRIGAVHTETVWVHTKSPTFKKSLFWTPLRHPAQMPQSSSARASGGPCTKRCTRRAVDSESGIARLHGACIGRARRRNMLNVNFCSQKYIFPHRPRAW